MLLIKGPALPVKVLDSVSESHHCVGDEHKLCLKLSVFLGQPLPAVVGYLEDSDDLYHDDIMTWVVSQTQCCLEFLFCFFFGLGCSNFNDKMMRMMVIWWCRQLKWRWCCQNDHDNYNDNDNANHNGNVKEMTMTKHACLYKDESSWHWRVFWENPGICNGSGPPKTLSGIYFKTELLKYTFK